MLFFPIFTLSLVKRQKMCDKKVVSQNVSLIVFAISSSNSSLEARCDMVTHDLNFFCLQAAAGLDLKDGPWPYPPVYPGYDAALAGYHFNG